MNKLRVMYILRDFPQLSHTYEKNEIEAVKDECDIRIIAMKRPNISYKNHVPFSYISNLGMIREAIEEFRPHVLHSHYLDQTHILAKLSSQTNVPFTIRAHSFDTIWPGKKSSLFDYIRLPGRDFIPHVIRKGMPSINDDLCLGILSFPFTRPTLERAGIRSEKIYDCYPVVNYRLFHDRSPNGQAIMNTGACIPKKKMEDFIRLATLVPNMEFNLYAIGYKLGKISRLNKSVGSPVNIIPPIEPEDMPREYKKHRWLVYTASHKLKTVGWPMAVAEAQASGVGVCMPNLRPDLREYVGDAGFLYNSISEVVDIISRPFPEEKRQIGFEHARKSDIFEHKVILTSLWRKAITSNYNGKNLMEKVSGNT
ncbi:MAG TPA: hypothetical protein VNN20_08740 [Thermodesulfobacteriota bacterium]|nr:hypothetical protein [Thermodesulfobacteriota bacterium]